MDFISVLPPELVLVIVLHLDLSSLACCLLVCTHWNEFLSNLEPYWSRACRKLGLTENIIRYLISRYGSSKRVALFADKQRGILLKSPHLSVQVTEGYPYNVHYVCNSVKGNKLIGTLYKDFKPSGIVIKSIEQSNVSRTFIDPKFPSRAENRTYWAHLVANKLVHVTASGLWSVYDITRNGSLLRQWKGASFFNSNAKIAICETCHSICTAKLVSSHSLPTYWDLRVISPSTSIGQQNGRPRTVRFKIDAAIQSSSGAKQTAYCKKSVFIFPLTTQTDSRGGCEHHSVLLQCGNTVYSYKLSRNDHTSTDANGDKLAYTPEYNLHMDVQTSNVPLKNSGLSTEMVLSQHQELLGIVFNSQLIVWERRTSKLLSIANIDLDTSNHEQVQLVALGRVYSLIGLEFSSTLLIVVTSTCQIVRKFSNFAHRHIPLVPPYIEYLGALQYSWLSDLTCTPTSALPTLVYWNKTNRVIEGITFGCESEKKTVEENASTRQRAWWRLW